ncbi:uncharacterized protein LOC134814744 [Bolinopsis microptera]|uniref:uncharacterized protein LOC134814744 n=1 Tax=Bolinopsis microptera TaxID=2820187 RepID=UPI0030797658
MLSSTLLRDLIVIKQLGAGGNGTVYLTQHNISLNRYVVKIFRDHPDLPMVYQDGTELPLEIATLRSLHHPNVVKYETHFLFKGEWYLLMEYEPGFSDLHTLTRKCKLTEKTVLNIAEQLYTVVDYCLQNNIDHGDIKEENILYNPKTNQLKLIDFGTALPLSKHPLNFLRGTTACLPPEAFSKPHYFPLQASVWAIGCVLYGCMTGRPAFSDTSDILNKRAKVPLHTRKFYSRRLVSLAERCLEPCRVLRIMWSELGRQL